MSNAQSTHITLILDRSGSMTDIQSDIIGGVNAFFETQRALKLPITASFIQFDSNDPFDVLAKHVHLDDIPTLSTSTYQPRGTTPLLDAIGQGIRHVDAYLETLDAGHKPEKTVMVVVTDGQENSSQMFTRAHIADLIKAKQDAGWEFIFLSSDLSAIEEAKDISFESGKSVQFSKSRVRESMALMSDKIASFNRRSNTDLNFSESERNTMGDDM